MKQELIEKARQAASPEEIMKIAEENDIAMCKEEAEMIYKQLHTNGELADDELGSVAGGTLSMSEWSREVSKRVCPKCGKKASSWGIYTFAAKFYCEDCDYRWSEENPWISEIPWLKVSGLK